MIEYFMFECYMPIDWDDMALLKSQYFKNIDSWRNDIDGWRYGRPLVSPIPDPLVFHIKNGYPNDLKEMYNSDALIMTRTLITALQEAGVTNMDVYPCTIINENTGFSTDEYAAVTLIGLVKAVDLDKSNASGNTDSLTDTDFDGLVINANHADTPLLFRLEENSIAIVIHHSVKEYLEDKGFDMLTFVDPGNWVG